MFGSPDATRAGVGSRCARRSTFDHILFNARKMEDANKERNKQMTIEHSNFFIKYRYNYMFRHREVIVRVDFKNIFKRNVQIALLEIKVSLRTQYIHSLFLYNVFKLLM